MVIKKEIQKLSVYSKLGRITFLIYNRNKKKTKKNKTTALLKREK